MATLTLTTLTTLTLTLTLALALTLTRCGRTAELRGLLAEGRCVSHYPQP